ncbi:sarcoplasmic calcium-binding protein-like isoform X2 [Crassostrea virginica]|uniref:Sarcoplasmic calcium-binding protein-like isoform X2 n=1 Tax=Crassostrea virginica TaxID=6565 RepID=A0A8B8C3L3_CRAVI|nr:sarcoplasmic calcium-binding protein-like isoform X2 [Crassostrea virginica]XP_022309766.1 sarcoplasmic calcium-binding protein-like isoform X2 [Crassostrea virginica]
MDYLTQKWKMWYKSLDVNHDGKISLEDVEESRNKFTELHHLLGDKADSVKADMKNWWTTYILTTPDQEISEEQFLSYLGGLYNTDKVAFKDRMQKCFDLMFDVIDTNKDRSIELSEFIFAWKAFGHENEELVSKAFKLFNAENGLVPLRDIVSAWVTFVTDDDSSKRDIVLEAFKSGV